jgi:hypothetical protein
MYRLRIQFKLFSTHTAKNDRFCESLMSVGCKKMQFLVHSSSSKDNPKDQRIKIKTPAEHISARVRHHHRVLAAKGSGTSSPLFFYAHADE